MNTIHERILCVAPARHWIVVASVRPRDSSSIRFEEKTTIANDLEKEREGDGGGGVHLTSMLDPELGECARECDSLFLE